MATRAKQIVDPILGTQIDASVSTTPNQPASRSFVATMIAGITNGADFKNPVRAAVFTNINLATPGSVFDGVTFTNSGVDSVLLGGNTTSSQNGLWTWNGASSPLTRRTDAVDSVGVFTEIQVPVGPEGTANANKIFKLVTPNPITVGTTNLTFAPSAVFVSPVPQASNINMVGLVTTADGQKATNTALATAPAAGSQIAVLVNSDTLFPGNGVKTTACYFSADGGATAKTYATIAAGDFLYWNGSIAKYQLDASDLISFLLNA